MSKQIPLTQGQFAIVDDEDFEMVCQQKWHLMRQKRKNYAISSVYLRPKGGTYIMQTLYLHRFIMRPPKGMEIDHKDHNGLNCQRDNMRICTHAENDRNSRSHVNSTSKYKGVFHDRLKGRWKASIRCNQRNINLGYFSSEVEAAQAYDAKAKEMFGEFACTNF